MDVTNSMSWIFAQIFSIIGQTYSLMDNIRFLGISLLDYCIMLLLLSVVIPLLLSEVKYSHRTERRRRSNDDKESSS